MAKVEFSVACNAVYQSKLDIPDEIKDDEDKVLKYIRDNLDNCNVDELEWLSDLDPEDAVTIEYIKDISSGEELDDIDLE